MGPDFLLKPESDWRTHLLDIHPIHYADPEIKRIVTVNAVLKDCQKATTQLIHYYSNWYCLKRSVAWFIKFKDVLLKLSKKLK